MIRELAIITSAMLASVACADPVKTMNAVHENANDSAKLFNEAVSKEVAVDAMLRERGQQATQILGTANSLLSRSDALLKAAESDKKALGTLKVSYDVSADLLKSSGENLAAMVKSFPLGDSVIKEGRELVVKGRDMVAQNPGENYQDRNFINQLISRFDSSSASLNAAMQRAQALGIKMSVAAPMMDGIKGSIDMAQDYVARLEGANASNAKDIAEALEFANAFYKTYSADYEAMSQRAQKARAVRSSLLNLFAKISAVEMNDFAGSEEYKFAPFKFARGIYLASIAYPVNPPMQRPAPMYGSALEEAAVMFDAAPAAKMRAADMSQIALGNSAVVSRNAPSPAPAQEGSEIDNSRRIRADILDIGTKLDNYIKRMNRAELIIGYLVSDAESALAFVSMNESSAQNLLRTVISHFGESQSLSSEMKILLASAKVNQIKAEISTEEMKKQFSEAEKLFAEAEKLGAEADKKLADTAKELK